MIAAEVGNIDRMRNLVDAMKQWDLIDKWMTKGDRKGRTPMHLASTYGYVNVIEFLVKEVIDRIENDENREKYIEIFRIINGVVVSFTQLLKEKH